MSLKPCLPTTYYSFLYCEQKYFVFRSRRKMKKKIESNQVKTNINFCFFGHYYHERKYQLFLYPKPELLPTLSVSLIQETKTLKTTKTEENYSCEKN